MPSPGLYSVENGLLVISICLLLGIKMEHILRELARLSVPGRFEAVALKSKPDSLFIIDYAHNGASLKAVIDALREYEPSRIICLFGSVGGRTFGRREELGKVASENADVIIITSDNPNNENPMRVINDIREAVGETDKPVYMIPDREEAVMKVYELAESGDYILLAGKGHETYQLIMGERVPFSERRILELADLAIYTK
jgi:UDP-N-acetylmuramoyl-L-alanyl-D-glutamate--2,6-diaminopimelate ligase